MTNEAIAKAFDGTRLKQARELALMTKKGLALELKVTPTAVSQFESGASKPRPDLIPMISQSLGFPPSYFAAGRPKANLDVSATYFRSLRSTPTKHLNRATAYTTQCWEIVNLLEEFVVFPDVDLPDFQFDSDVRDFPFSDPASAAIEIRKMWGLDLSPVPHLVRQMESHGIVVFLAPKSDTTLEKVDAYSTSSLPRPIVMLTTGRSDDALRLRFSTAHELGHLVLHAEQASGDSRIEREADTFAGEFLAPTSILADLLPRRLDFSTLANLSDQWGISITALIYRSKSLGIISESTARRAYIKLGELQKERLLSSPKVGALPGEIPSLLQSAAQLAFEEEGISNAELAERLAWHESQVDEFLANPDRRPKLRLVR